ncbi:hypothetical protein V6N11_079266 [Hibiscus sabdariffa]|uniref:F-box protein n=1 Tax=Hibiscus sabdariffa TaxID=183260 RepID=A0ABR2RV59_9ROSI
MGNLPLRRAAAELHDLWVMKEYGVVEPWTKVLTLHLGGHCPRVLAFRMNGEVLLEVDDGEMASLDLNSQRMESRGVEVGTGLFSVEGSYVENLVLLDKGVDVPLWDM